MSEALLDLQVQVDFVAEALGRKRAWAEIDPRDDPAIAHRKIGFHQDILQANVCFQYTNNASRMMRRLPTFSWGPVASFESAPRVEMDLEGLLGEVADLFHRVPPSPWYFSRNLLELPELPPPGLAVRSSAKWPVRAIRDYHIGTDSVLVRFDVLYYRA